MGPLKVAAAIYGWTSAACGGCATAAAVSWKRLSAACSTAVGACASLPAMVAEAASTVQSLVNVATSLPCADAGRHSAHHWRIHWSLACSSDLKTTG